MGLASHDLLAKMGPPCPVFIRAIAFRIGCSVDHILSLQMFTMGSLLSYSELPSILEVPERESGP